MTPSVFADLQPNPSWEDARNIVTAYIEAEADCIIAVGGAYDKYYRYAHAERLSSCAGKIMQFHV